MSKTHISEAKIASVLRHAYGVISIPDFCRENGISVWTFKNWRKKFGDMDASSIRIMQDQNGEILRLKRLNSVLSIQNQLMKEALRKTVKRGVRSELARQAVKVRFRLHGPEIAMTVT